ncbi:MAG: hypothetical protein PHO56_05255 [Patescibacteria group bacterium]|nr:hypothetical protein [Patescibacteria group bacterium]
MIKKKYLDKIKREIKPVAHSNKRAKFFIFGSSLRGKNFGDVDLGVSGKINSRDIAALKENFVNSTIPYFMDIIDFNKTSKEFKKNVFSDKILWIKR